MAAVVAARNCSDRKQKQLNSLVDAELRQRTLVPSTEPHLIMLADLQPPAAAAQLVSCAVTIEACQFGAVTLTCSAVPTAAQRFGASP